MSKKLYDHIISTNYANINTKIQVLKKKKKASKIHAKNNIPS